MKTFPVRQKSFMLKFQVRIKNLSFIHTVVFDGRHGTERFIHSFIHSFIQCE